MFTYLPYDPGVPPKDRDKMFYSCIGKNQTLAPGPLSANGQRVGQCRSVCCGRPFNVVRLGHAKEGSSVRVRRRLSL